MDFSWPNSIHLCFYTLLVILSSLLLPSVSVITHVSCLPDQSSSLLQLKRGFLQSDLTSWQPGTDCCRGWEGVSCDKATGHVTALDISNRNIQGNLSAAIFNLTSLQHLNLACNNFSQNQIPAHGFEKLTMLTHLNLSNTYFIGQIPIAIANLTSLISLDLSNHGLKLHEPNLRVLVSQLSNLRELYLDHVDISENGTEWCRALSESVPHLQVLSMVFCNLSGPIEPSLSQLDSLTVLHLSYNSLKTQIPDYFAEFPLKELLLNGCDLEGLFPHEIFHIPTLTKLDLSYNGELFGTLPNFPIVSSLESLVLDKTNHFGSIPDSIGNLRNLSELSLVGCNFSGQIPSFIEKLNKLAKLDLSYNSLSGSIPPSLFSLPNLSLRGNKLSGILSHHISRSCALVILDLNSNNLEGNLPGSLTRCKDLELLDIGNNYIRGTFPFSLGKLPNLQVIVLRSNKFYGTLDLPANFGNMNSLFPLLRIIDLASNNFNGSLPPLWFNNFKSIQKLSSDATLGETVETVNGYVFYSKIGGISVTITDKGVQTTLEHDLVNLMNLIDLSSNRFTGDIPKTIGELEGIKALNLSHNAFTGSIPNLLGCLTQIESLDLSWNQLSGEIPQELIFLTSLSVLNLSFNHLVGRIPQSNQFLTFQNSSFEGNPRLCGVPLSKLCNIQIPGNNSTSPSTKPATKMTEIVLLCLFIGLGFGTGFGTGFAIVIIGPKMKRARNEHATR